MINFAAIDATFERVKTELIYADEKWGTEFDDKNTLSDWVAYTINYIGQATRMDATEEGKVVALRKAIGLLTNALVRIETQTMAKRHFD